MTPRRRPRRSPPVALGAGSAGPDAPYRALVARTATDDPEGTHNAPWILTLSEREFQALVRGALESRGFVVWVVPMMKLTTAGLPDILAWHPRLPGVLLALELKREKDFRVTPKQLAALAHLETVEGVLARIVRPSEWPGLRDAIDAMLAAREAM
jgi:hypothetical protein